MAMKTKIFLLSFLLALFTFNLSAQSLQKGNLIGTHTLTVTLKPGVTMEQYINFTIEKWIPAFVSVHPGWQCYVVRSVRGDAPKDSFGLIFIVNSEKDRDLFFTPDGHDSETGKAAFQKIQPIYDELLKLADVDDKYTDWVVI